MLESDQEEDNFFDTSGTHGEDQQLLKNSDANDKSPDDRGSKSSRLENVLAKSSKYPRSVFFILGTEFCERFSYYGLRSILVLYFTEWLGITKNTATAYFHTFSFLAYFSPIFGALIADSYLGRYKTILYISLIYGIGCLVLSLTALPPPNLAGPLVGLILISLSTGGIKPCVVTFGGEQFTADQEKERNTFFSAFYFMINLGSLISTFLTPVLRADVHCIERTCYPLAFGLPAILMFTATVIFFSGRKRYKHVLPTGSLFTKMSKCIVHGIRMRYKHRKYLEEEKTHWLDYAADKFEISFIEDVKRLLRVLLLFVPLPMFWALFNQQGSRWTLQATEMDGKMGALGQMKPDQMQAMNSLLIIILIPVFDRVFYPLLDYCHIPTRLLQRMVTGMLFCALAFFVAALIQTKIENSKDVPLYGKSGFTFLNTLDCVVDVKDMPDLPTSFVPQLGMSPYLQTSPGTKQLGIKCADSKEWTTATVNFESNLATRLVIASSTSGAPVLYQFPDSRLKSAKGWASVSLVNLNNEDISFKLKSGGDIKPISINVTNMNATSFHEYEPGNYHLAMLVADSSGRYVWQDIGKPFTLGSGSIYSVAIMNIANISNVDVIIFNSIQEKSVSIFLQIPQYIIITIGEVFFSISGLNFAYTQAPVSMRSVVQASWLLTTAFGDLIVVFVAEVRFMPTQTAEFYLFASLMIADTIIFAVMAYFYHYVHPDESKRTSMESNDNIGLIATSQTTGKNLQSHYNRVD